MARAPYETAIVKTFRENALRTAHIIDDSFPTYGQLAAHEDAKTEYKEWALATELYELFRAHHIPCDVENTVNTIRGDVERIRKSDLIVLDYNLLPGDTRMSVSLVRELARTQHFNTIIVYTLAEDLNEVWLNFAAALRGGWAKPDEADAAADRELSALRDDGLVLDSPSREMMSDFIAGRSIAQKHPAEWKVYAEALDGKDVAKDRRNAVIGALIRREMLEFLKDDHESADGPKHSVDGRCRKDGPLWLQSGNCFVVVMGKPKDDPRSVAADKLFEALDDALCDWRPNLLQVIVSEIQNILESDALATHDLHLRDPHTQVSLCYFLLLALGEGAPPPEVLEGPVHTLLDKLVDGVRQTLVTDKDLRSLAAELLTSELGRLAIPAFEDQAKRRKGLFEAAQKMAGSEHELDAQQALLKLNAFLSSEPFRGSLTTGTVFCSGDLHWICMTPACDMVARPPGQGQDWLQRLHPMKPIVAVRLKSKDATKALKEAEFSRSLFLRTKGTMLMFDVLPDKGGPNYEFIYLRGTPLTDADGTVTFDGYRVWREEGVADPPTALSPVTFTVVGQVRADYASRFLQETGAWLSRIGVDFIRGAG